MKSKKSVSKRPSFFPRNKSKLSLFSLSLSYSGENSQPSPSCTSLFSNPSTTVLSLVDQITPFSLRANLSSSRSKDAAPPAAAVLRSWCLTVSMVLSFLGTIRRWSSRN